MGDPVCCILAVCCPGGGNRQREALAGALRALSKDAPNGIGERSTERLYADYIIDNYDLAPKDSLASFKTAIAGMARQGDR